VLARLLFGRALTQISPLQAAQMANAVATLAGTGGEGLIGRLRREFGLDDLDLTTTDEGKAAVRVGKYITEKVYTDVTIDRDGKSEINLNFDINDAFTAKGLLKSTGETGVGIYFEKDY
jgi:translocation and assembly module TamB